MNRAETTGFKWGLVRAMWKNAPVLTREEIINEPPSEKTKRHFITRENRWKFINSNTETQKNTALLVLSEALFSVGPASQINEAVGCKKFIGGQISAVPVLFEPNGTVSITSIALEANELHPNELFQFLCEKLSAQAEETNQKIGIEVDSTNPFKFSIGHMEVAFMPIKSTGRRHLSNQYMLSFKLN